MISKVFDGHSFYHACRYICNKKDAEVLRTEGVRGHDPKLMAQDFILQAEQRPSKRQACFHSVLSFYPGEQPESSLMVEIAERYLQEIGIKDTQYAIALHRDRAHLHLHIIANMVDNNGRAIKDNWIGLKGKKVAIKLTQEYHLVPAEKKNLSLTHPEALGESEANRYKVYTAIVDNLPACLSLEDLERRLSLQGIIMQYKFKGGTTERQGISFKIGDDCFKGSKVDRQFSLGNLEKALAANRKRATGQEQEAISQAQGPAKGQLSRPSPTGITATSVTVSVGKTMAGLIARLLEPEPDYNLPPDDPTKRKRKKRRRY